MTSLFQRLFRNERGGSMIEFAFAVPVLILFIYGIFTIGLLFQANAGMQHALGEGARYATLCLNPTPTAGCTVPTNTQIQAVINAKLFGKGKGTFTVPEPTGGTGFRTLTVNYTVPTDFLFFPGPTVAMSQSKKVYIAA